MQIWKIPVGDGQLLLAIASPYPRGYGPVKYVSFVSFNIVYIDIEEKDNEIDLDC